jgi:hypothetical protein
MSDFRSVGRRCAAVLVAALAFVLVAAVPAQAKIPSGEGWSASWRYYDPKGIEYKVTLPGVAVDGFISDDGGVRRMVGQLHDIAPADSYCARALAIVPGDTIIDDQTTCAGSVDFGNFQTDFTGTVYIFVYQMFPFGPGDPHNQNHTVIPASAEDPGLRTVGTGTSWEYTSATTYSYEVRRPSVRVSGNGHHEQYSDGRSAYSTVERQTSSIFGCSSGSTTASKIVKSATTCAPYSVASFTQNDIKSAFAVEACSTGLNGPKRCLSTTVPQPK